MAAPSKTRSSSRNTGSKRPARTGETARSRAATPSSRPRAKAAPLARARATAPATRSRVSAKSGAKTSATVASTGALDERLAATLDELERLGTAKTRAGMVRYGITTADRVLGVTMGDLRALGKRLGRQHDLAAALWASGCYEARLLTAFVADPEQLRPAEMERWCRQFDNWAVCDTLCFALFDRSPHAFSQVAAWAARPEEFVRRAAFALLAGLALHDRESDDAAFVAQLPHVEHAASDARNFVKKGVSWALRAIGGRSPALNAASLELAERLGGSSEPAARWVGKDALRDLKRPVVRQRGTARAAKRAASGAGKTGKKRSGRPPRVSRS